MPAFTLIWASSWENRFFAYAKTKTQISFGVTAKLISAYVFATWIVQPLFFLNPKFQACSNLLWLYSLVSVGPGRKPRRPVFSQRGSYVPWAVCVIEGKKKWFKLLKKKVLLADGAVLFLRDLSFEPRSSVFQTWSYTNWAVLPQTIARGLKFRI